MSQYIDPTVEFSLALLTVQLIDEVSRVVRVSLLIPETAIHRVVLCYYNLHLM